MTAPPAPPAAPTAPTKPAPKGGPSPEPTVDGSRSDHPFETALLLLTAPQEEPSPLLPGDGEAAAVPGAHPEPGGTIASEAAAPLRMASARTMPVMPVVPETAQAPLAPHAIAPAPMETPAVIRPVPHLGEPAVPVSAANPAMPTSDGVARAPSVAAFAGSPAVASSAPSVVPSSTFETDPLRGPLSVTPSPHAVSGTPSDKAAPPPSLPGGTMATLQLAERMTGAVRRGQSKFTVDLHPSELGRVQIDITVREGQVRATLLIERPETLHQLQGELRQLERQLDQNGLRLAANGLRLDLDGGTGERRSGTSSHQGSHDGSEPPQAPSVVSVATGDSVAQVATPGPDGRLDVRY